MIFLINETGEDVRIFHCAGSEDVISSTLITHEWMSAVVGNHRLEDKSWDVTDRFVQEQNEIRFQVKRQFFPSIRHVVCDLQVRNNHLHIIFSSIAKILNRTHSPLIIETNDQKLRQRKEKIDVDEEYHVPISCLYENAIAIDFDG